MIISIIGSAHVALIRTDPSAHSISNYYVQYATNHRHRHVAAAKGRIKVNEMKLTGLMWRGKNSINLIGSNNTINFIRF